MTRTIYFSTILTLLEATCQLTQGCHGGSPPPFDTYDTYLQYILLNHLPLTLSKYLPIFIIWSLLLHLIIFSCRLSLYSYLNTFQLKI